MGVAGGQERRAPWLRYPVESDASSVTLCARLEAVLDLSGLSILQAITLGTDVPCRTDRPGIRFSHNKGWPAVSYTMTVDCPGSGEWFFRCWKTES